MKFEVDTKNDEAKAHDDTALEKEDASARAFDQQRRNVSGNGLDDTNDDGRDGRVDVRAGGLEDVVGVEDDGVDAAELLEEHEAQGTDESHAGCFAGHDAEDAAALARRVVHLQ